MCSSDRESPRSRDGVRVTFLSQVSRTVCVAQHGTNESVPPKGETIVYNRKFLLFSSSRSHEILGDILSSVPSLRFKFLSQNLQGSNVPELWPQEQDPQGSWGSLADPCCYVVVTECPFFLLLKPFLLLPSLHPHLLSFLPISCLFSSSPKGQES